MKLKLYFVSLLTAVSASASDIYSVSIPYYDKTIEVISMVTLSSTYKSNVAYNIEVNDPDVYGTEYCAIIGSVVVGTIENVLYLKNNNGVTVDGRSTGVRKLTLHTTTTDDKDPSCSIRNRSFIGNASSGWVINEWFKDSQDNTHANVAVQFGAKALAFAEEKYQGLNITKTDLSAYSLTSFYKNNRLQEDQSINLPLKLKN